MHALKVKRSGTELTEGEKKYPGGDAQGYQRWHLEASLRTWSQITDLGNPRPAR